METSGDWESEDRIIGLIGKHILCIYRDNAVGSS